MMSIEALPNELLVKIFSHLSWVDSRLVEQRRNQVNALSLVNQRWNQVIGQRATLKMSKVDPEQPRLEVDSCIPLEVLCGSSREYRKFSCSLLSMDLHMISGTFGAVLEYCHQRWNMKELHIISRYDQFILFLEHHMHLLNNVVRADIPVFDNLPLGTYFEEGDPRDTHFVLAMEKLQQLKMSYIVSSFCSLSFHAPILKVLEVKQGVRNKLHLILQDSTKLRSVCYIGTRTLNPEGQASKTIRLVFMGCSIATTLSAMFGNLQTVSLCDVTITPIDDALECLNLTKLTLRGVKLQKLLKLRVPQLHTLTCDIEALQLLHLQDAFKADVLDIILAGRDIYNAQNFPVGLSGFRRLHLVQRDKTSICWLWPYLSGITELHIVPTCSLFFLQQTFHVLRNMWKHFPQLNSLDVLRLEVPDNFNFLPINVQNVSIENCRTEGCSIEFPPSVERVRVKNLCKWMKDTSSSAEMILLPPNRYSPLELVREEVGSGMVTTPRLTCSTKDCRDMENYKPPRISRTNILIYTR